MTEKNSGNRLSPTERQKRRMLDLRTAIAEKNPSNDPGIHLSERKTDNGKNELIVQLSGVRSGTVESSIGPITVNGIERERDAGLASSRNLLNVDLTAIEGAQQGRRDKLGGVRRIGINKFGIGAERINPDATLWVVVSGTTHGDITPKLS